MEETIRETPASKVQERYKIVHQRREEILDHLIMNAHADPIPFRVKSYTGLMRVLERVGIWICRAAHNPPVYNSGELYSTCSCGRKYAVPWVFDTHPTIKPMFILKLDPNVYINSEPFLKPSEPTRQTTVR